MLCMGAKSVSEKSRVLVVDAGNTSTKWTAFDGDEIVWVKRDLEKQDLSAQMCEFDGFVPEYIYYASVLGGEADKALIDIVRGVFAGGELYHLKTAESFLGIKNPYTEPERLGVDRWLGVIAAKIMYSSPVVLIDAGTAIKVEFIEADGCYRGGYIVPSFDMMTKMLVANTGKIRISESDALEGADLITNSGMAVYQGCWQMVLAFVERLYQQHKGKNFVFTGGNGQRIMQELQVKGEYEANLVAYGAKFFGDELVSR